jgi:Nif-specific regulatory protein
LLSQSEDRIRREKQLEVLKMAATHLEKSSGFVDGLREILSSLEKYCDLVYGRLAFLDGVVDIGKDIRATTQEKSLDPQVDEAMLSAQQDVLRNWRPKMVPVTQFESSRFHGAFDVERNLQLYVLCHPVKFGERRMGTLTAVKVCFGSFEPKTEQAFLSILTSMIAQSAMINRFYPDQEGETNAGPMATSFESLPFDRSHIIGNSKAMLSVFELMQQVADTETTVLILGESGVGKELIADGLHRNSVRRNKPFIKVNCAALPETLLESELFGHERGAFTGAHAQKKGRFELANGGTLFLDEIGDLSLTTQIKLLRVLQQREFERLGGVTTIKCDVRVIAATNRKLEKMIEQGLFRQDLYYRLNVFPLHVPPLRERKTDIMPITDFFIDKYKKIHNKNIRRISTPAIDMLSSYHWPGNVRELENCIERAVLLTNEGVIRGHHLPPSLQIAESVGVEAANSMRTVLESMERELILDALKASKGNMAKAARELGLTERVMGLRAKKYNLDPRKFRKPGAVS